MRLIDTDTIDDYLGEWAEEFYKKAENADADFMDGYCMTINRIQSSKVATVDAIPISFINQLIELSRKVGADHHAESLEVLLSDWVERKEE